MNRLPTEPVRHTCPDIDHVMSTLENVFKQMDKCDSADSVEELLENIQDWKHDIGNIGVGKNCDMENLRDSNSALRDWGHTLYAEAESLQSEIYELENKLADAERKRDQFESKFEDMLSDYQELNERMEL